MFRAAKRKPDKNNIKVVFRLQFHVTQVPQSGWDKLFVSLIPVETGKVTAKTGKASVHNGTCEWADPVYETTRLVQEVKTGKCDEKLYNLVVSTGSSRLGLLGETTIDLTDYVGAVSPSSVSLPLQSCNAGTVLHVMIQRVSAKPGFRDLDQKRDLVEAGPHGMSAEAIVDDERNESALISEETTDGHGSEDNSFTTSTVRFSSDSREVAFQHAEASENYTGYIAADAISTSSSGRSSTTKRELPDVHETGGINNGIHQDAVSFLSSLSKNAKPPKSVTNTGHSLAHTRQHKRSNSEWGPGKGLNYCGENVKSNIYEENEKLKENLQASESTIEELQNEVSSLGRQADGLTVETETLKAQLAREIKKGQEFAKEISSLKVERYNMKLELEQLKALGQESEKQKTVDKARHEIDDNARCVIEELKHELRYEKQVNTNLNLQLQKTQESNIELLLAVQDLDELLEQKNKEIAQISSNGRCGIPVFTKNCEASSFQDIEREWLQKLSYSEQKIREIKDIIILNDTGRNLEFIQDDMDILETTFQEARQESISLICKLNNEIDTRNEKIATLEYDMQSLPGKGPLLDNIANKAEAAKIWNARGSNFCLDEDERADNNPASKQCPVCDLQPMQDKILELNKAQLELENMNQNLEEEARMNRLNIADLEEKIVALTASNLNLESKIEILEGENIELQNCLNAAHEAGNLAREQIAELMEEMSLVSAKTESDSGIRKSTDNLPSEVENDHVDIGSALFHLQEQNEQLLKRISELESQLEHEKQKKEPQQIAKEAIEESMETQRNHESILILEQKILGLSNEVEDYKRARDCLAKEIEQIEQEYESLKQEHEECALGKSEEQLRIFGDEHATSLSTMTILENKVENLQQEIEKQAAAFAVDLDAMAKSKMEQEQRAKRAEEALRKIRWDNASTAERLQKEFKRLSQQMSSTVDVNEKLATQALAECSELRAQKNDLQEQLGKAEEEIVLIKEQFSTKIQELTTQLDLAVKHGEASSLELQRTLDELENLKKNETDYISRNEELSLKLTMLKTEVQALTDEKIGLMQKVKEYECLKGELDGAKVILDSCRTEKTQLEVALQRANQDKAKLDEEVSLLKENLRNSEAELDEVKHCRDDQEIRVTFLESRLDEQAAQISLDSEQKNELTQLRIQHGDLNHKLSEKVSETEDLRKQIFYLQEELKQKTDRLAAVQKKLKDKEENSKVHAGAGPARPTSRSNNKVGPVSRNGKELTDLREKVTLLEDEVKSRTIALEALRKEFNAKEKNLHIKIEQLEMISQNLEKEDLSSNMDQLQDKVNEHLENINCKCEEPVKSGNAINNAPALEIEPGDALEGNHIYQKQLESTLVNIFTKQEDKQSAALQNYSDINELLDDLVVLKRKNSMMEDELKEMHDRYSEISLKFAEVEGEREQLVMTIKNLRNVKKT